MKLEGLGEDIKQAAADARINLSPRKKRDWKNNWKTSSDRLHF
jgi:hypothetical protein